LLETEIFIYLFEDQIIGYFEKRRKQIIVFILINSDPRSTPQFFFDLIMQEICKMMIMVESFVEDHRPINMLFQSFKCAIAKKV
jgi:hypothetical protein